MLKPESVKQAIDYRQIIDVLMADDRFADLVLYGGNVVNVITKEIYTADIAVKGDYIALVGDCESLIGEKTTVVDVRGKYLTPGFIDSHMHFESAMLTITEFSKLSIPTGTTTLMADPHEIGNALGSVAMKAMADECNHVPNYVRLQVPALTPDAPKLETAGVEVNSKDMEDLLNYPNINGIGELQGFSLAKHVYKHTPEIIDDLLASTTYAKSIGKPVDGNAPELFGAELAAHIVACGGNCSCHETTTKAECIEKIRQGVYVFMREGSTQRNMAECIKAVTEEGLDSRRLILVSDDMVPTDLETAGHMNDLIRRTIREGVDPVEAIQMATINPATYWGFKDRGALLPGKVADIAVIDDLNEMTVAAVFIKGKLMASQGKMVVEIPSYTYPDTVKNSVKIKHVTEADLEINADGSTATVRYIQAIPDQNLTGTGEAQTTVNRGIVQPDLSQDLVYLGCMERYGHHGSIGKCMVKGFGLKQGAVAQSIAHDTHNITYIGANLKDIAIAINRVAEIGGGLVLVNNGRVVDELALPVGGLMTDEMTGSEVGQKVADLENMFKTQLGGSLHAPFMHLSFLALSTSPEWKITDQGLVDVNNFEVLDPVVR
ncbi:adenine deaminase [Andreesenia angusta]|uniref:Adenine deaminase n=1 Tax=Andreesenia angusta TaxID=39480 RepID=A0A1S1V3P2_9FIRM|nr:adenine deaminase C-terminal domain-containing protein [Andreesenia angusta]OHW61326.1 adenine deaminase [Andreesenia angusta]